MNNKVLVKLNHGIYIDFVKAQTHKYIKRIPKPTGKGYYYFYNQEQLKEYREKGIIPGESAGEKVKNILTGIINFFKCKDEKEAREKAAAEFEKHKNEFKGVPMQSFVEHLNEYLTNKDKWDIILTGKKKRSTGEKKGGADTGGRKKSGNTTVGKKFNKSIMRKIADIYGSEKKEDFADKVKAGDRGALIPKKETEEKKEEKGNINNPESLTNDQIFNYVKEAAKLDKKKLQRNADIINQEIEMAKKQNKPEKTIKKLEFMGTSYRVAELLKEDKSLSKNEIADLVRTGADIQGEEKRNSDKPDKELLDHAIKHAADLGAKAAKDGKKLVPAQDNDLMDVIGRLNLKPGEGAGDILKSYQDGFIKESQKEPKEKDTMEDVSDADKKVREDVEKEIKSLEGQIKYSEKRIKESSESWEKKEYQKVIDTAKEKIEEKKKQLENIDELKKKEGEVKTIKELKRERNNIADDASAEINMEKKKALYRKLEEFDKKYPGIRQREENPSRYRDEDQSQKYDAGEHEKEPPKEKSQEEKREIVDKAWQPSKISKEGIKIAVRDGKGGAKAVDVAPGNIKGTYKLWGHDLILIKRTEEELKTKQYTTKYGMTEKETGLNLRGGDSIAETIENTKAFIIDNGGEEKFKNAIDRAKRISEYTYDADYGKNEKKAEADKKEAKAKEQEQKEAAKSEEEKNGESIRNKLFRSVKENEYRSNNKLVDNYVNYLITDEVKNESARTLHSMEKDGRDVEEVILKRRDGYVKAANKLLDNIKNKNNKELKDILHTGNKTSRKLFEGTTGISLGTSNKSMEEAINKFTAKSDKNEESELKYTEKDYSDKTRQVASSNGWEKWLTASDKEVNNKIEDYKTRKEREEYKTFYDFITSIRDQRKNPSGSKLEKAITVLYSELQKAGGEKANHKYYKRIPNPKGNGYIYFYSPEQLKEYVKSGKIPDQGNKKKDIGKKSEPAGSKREALKNTLKKIGNILADAFSGKDVVNPTGQAVEEAGKNVQFRPKTKFNEEKS